MLPNTKELVANKVQKFWSYQRSVYSLFFDNVGLRDFLQINPLDLPPFSKGDVIFGEIVRKFLTIGH
jgi:hypothetical protein